MQLLLLLVLLCLGATTGKPRNWQEIFPAHPQVSAPFRPGYQLPEGKVVGGSEAEPNSFPHQAALFMEKKDKTYFCGGSLISTRCVLTAAHCPDGALSVEVVLGAHNIRNENEETQVRIVAERYVIHEEYDANAISDDIAVVWLPEGTVILSDIIQTIALPTWSNAEDDFYTAKSTVSGWGKISDGDSTYTSLLHYAEAPIIDNKLCDEWYFGIIRDTNICTDGSEKKSPCNGDSGGALVVNGTEVGIVSFGIIFGCEVNFPGAFTRVTKYLKWIEENSDVQIKP